MSPDAALSGVGRPSSSRVVKAVMPVTLTVEDVTSQFAPYTIVVPSEVVSSPEIRFQLESYVYSKVRVSVISTRPSSSPVFQVLVPDSVRFPVLASTTVKLLPLPYASLYEPPMWFQSPSM